MSMNIRTSFLRAVLTVGAALPMSAVAAVAQTPAIVVKSGASIPYMIQSTVAMLQGEGTQAFSVTMATRSDAELKAAKVEASGIDWTLTLSNARLRMVSPGTPNGTMDSAVNLKPVSFTTDPQGRLSTSLKAGSEMQSFLASGMASNFSMEQFFSPTLTRAVKAGDSWETQSSDTVAPPSMQGFRIVVKRTVRFTYDGVVDTLQTQAHRVRAEVKAMALEGKGELQGMNMHLNGGGTSSWICYYTAAENLMLASRTEGETRMLLTVVGTDKALPLAQTYNVVLDRAVH